MLNLILHITLPAGIRLTNNAVLDQEVTFDVLSACDPFYASVEQVKLAGGPLLRKLQDITIACEIYNASKECSLLHLRKPYGYADDLYRYQNAQNQWVQAKAARELLLNVTTMSGGPGSHVLANFSVNRQKGFESEGTPERLKELKEKIKLYDITLRSGGRVAPGGHVVPAMAAKGVLDFAEKSPGRNWMVSGMGANGHTDGRFSSTGGRGKSVSFYGSPMFSGMMMGYRMGMWQSGSPLYCGTPFSFPMSGYC
jgi:hypothetical protein